MNTNSNIILEKLDQFTRKFYINKIIRGVILSFTLAAIFILIPSLFEYYGRYSTTVRTFVFYFIVLAFTAILIFNIILPLLKLFRIGKTLSHKQAAIIISKHFGQLEDKLVNTLELLNYQKNSNISIDLLLASIQQRIEHIKPLSFTLAVDLRENVKYLKYLAVVAIVFLLIIVFYPALIVEGSSRLVNHNIVYSPKALFEFNLLNDSLKIQQGDDIELKINVTGKVIPEKVYINIGSNNYIMQSENRNTFAYKLKNVNNTISFYVSAQGVSSDKFDIVVLPNPLIIDFSVEITPPAYTGEPVVELKNIGDLTVPVGSVVKWIFNTKDIDSLNLKFDDKYLVAEKIELINKAVDRYSCNKNITKSENYSISVINKFIRKPDVVNYSVVSIPDLFPEISAVEAQDSVYFGVYYFRGVLNDDYGFTQLNFIIEIDSLASTDFKNQNTIQINTNINAQEFYFSYDFSKSGIKQGQAVGYYFEVFDNDVVNGFKASRTIKKTFRIPTADEIEEKKNQTNKNIESNISQGMQMASELRKDLEKLQESAINKSSSAWQQEQMLKNIADKQKQIENLLKEVKNQNKEKNVLNNSFTEQQQSILEKQKQLEEMLENLMTDELKELLKQIEELQKNMEDSNFNEQIKDLKMSYEDLEKELDKNLELFKKFEVEEKINSAINELEQLAKEQEQLSEQTQDKKSDENVLKEKQQEQEQKFDDVIEKYNDAVEKNKNLENPMQLDNFQKEKDEIKKDFNQGKENLEQDNRKKASENQKQNSKKLEKMASSMASMMQMNSAMTISQSIEELRQILENLVQFSFEQEKLMADVQTVYPRDPKYVGIIATQKKLNDDFLMIRDSLFSLAKKTPQLGNTVDKEVTQILSKSSQSLTLLEDRRASQAAVNQQFVMTSANNLALLLSEILSALQQQKAGGMPGEQNCQKPGNMPGMAKMKQQQQSLKEQLEQMLNQMKDGQMPGGKDAKKSMAKMLSQQEVFSKMLQDMKNDGNLQNQTMKLLDEINRMAEENKRDIVKNKISRQTLNRQNEIMTRLLEAENAEREREFEQRRESNTADDSENKKPINEFPDFLLEKSFREELEMSNVKLQNFYKNKYKSYILKLNQ